MSPQRDLIGPLYFGAQGDVIPKLLCPVFDGARSRRLTGCPVFLSSSIADVYEDGAYEEYASVLEVWLHRRTRWRYRPMANALRCGNAGEAIIELTHDDRRALDAVRIGSGQVWYVWNQSAIAIVRRLDYREAIPLLCQALDAAGPMASFGGVVRDYASIWWERVQENPRLSVLQYRQRLERVLRRYMGRKRSHSCQSTADHHRLAIEAGWEHPEMPQAEVTSLSQE